MFFIAVPDGGGTSNMYFDVDAFVTGEELAKWDCSYDEVVAFNAAGDTIIHLYKQHKHPASIEVNKCFSADEVAAFNTLLIALNNRNVRE